jgi:hypothetical protein
MKEEEEEEEEELLYDVVNLGFLPRPRARNNFY